ncbi:MAG: hypothetical protein OES09_16650, partial [Gammaproteobacteria bacterium]|nr:hypothetical protein [Gammaproteobacteria bacterium]
ETEIVLESMSAHGLITVTTVDSPRYLPGRPLDLISLRDVLCAVRRYPDRDDRLVDQESARVSTLLDDVLGDAATPRRATADIRSLLDDEDAPDDEVSKAPVPARIPR